MRDANYDWKGSICSPSSKMTLCRSRSTIYGGVKIGEGSIIAATSLVTRDVELIQYTRVAAKKVKDRFNTVEDLHKHLELVKSKYIGIL